MGHELQDRVSLEMARRVAAELPRRPEWVAMARANLDRWDAVNKNSPSLLRCNAEWRAILERPIVNVVAILTAETDEGQRLRQNSPFVGMLTPTEVWEIKRRLRDEQAAA